MDTRDSDAGTEVAGSSRLSRRQALRGGAASVAGLAWALTVGHGGVDLVKQLAHLAQGKPMTATRLVELLQTERANWNALLAEIGPQRMEIPGAEGDWSVKEVIAHLTWYEQAVVDGARQVLGGGEFKRPGDTSGEGMDARNVRIAAETRARTLADVRADADATFNQLLQMLSGVPDALLNDARVLNLPDDVPPWMRVANNSYLHYQQHAESLRSWLARQ